MDYSFDRFEEANLVKLDILINGEKVDALAGIVHRDYAQQRGKALAEKMKELKEVNKYTFVDKPYKMVLLESSIHPKFKSEALKKLPPVDDVVTPVVPCFGS